jgi:hypothetical protein
MSTWTNCLLADRFNKQLVQSKVDLVGVATPPLGVLSTTREAIFSFALAAPWGGRPLGTGPPRRGAIPPSPVGPPSGGLPTPEGWPPFGGPPHWASSAGGALRFSPAAELRNMSAKPREKNICWCGSV